MSEPDKTDLKAVRRLLERLQLEPSSPLEDQVKHKNAEPRYTASWDATSGHNPSAVSDVPLQPPALVHSSEFQQIAAKDDIRRELDGRKGSSQSWLLIALTVLAISIISTTMVWQFSNRSINQPGRDLRAETLFSLPPRIPDVTRPVEQANVREPLVREAVQAPVAAPTASAPSPPAPVSPASPPASSPVAIAQNTGAAGNGPVPPPEARDIDMDEGAQNAAIKRGEDLLRTGNVAQARLVFEFAANAGNPTAALRLGDTYDPQRLAELGTVGTMGDINQAIRWYEVADELGSALAKSRLADLATAR